MNDSAGKKLFAGAARTLEQVSETARKGEPQAFPLAVTARLQVVSRQKSCKAANVVAKIEGSDPVLRNEYVVYTAHLDHLGICPPVAGDNVCHGAIDNASGTATLLEIARGVLEPDDAPASKRHLCFCYRRGDGVAWIRFLRDLTHGTPRSDRGRTSTSMERPDYILR